MRSQHDKSASESGQVQHKAESVGHDWAAGRDPGLGEGLPPASPADDDSIVLEAPSALGPYLIIKGPQNHSLERKGIEKPENCELERPACGFAGLDTLHIAYSIEWGLEFQEKHLRVLADLKQQAASSEGPGSTLMISGVPLEVAPNGAQGGVFRHFILTGFEDDGFVFELSAISAPDKDYINGYVRVGAVPCNLRSLREIEKTIEAVISSLGGKVLAAIPSRVDMKADTTLFTPEDVVRAWIEKRMITRAKKGTIHWELLDINGFKAGVETQLRIYDKPRELKAKPNVWKEEIIQRQWGGMPEVLTRVEYQLRRDALAGFKGDGFEGISSFDDLEKALPGLWHYLTSKFFRIAKGEVDRKNPQRAKIVSWWEAVQNAWEPGKEWIKLEKNWKAKDPSPVHMARQSVGCLISSAPSRVNDVESFLTYSIESLRKVIDKMGLEKFQGMIAARAVKRNTIDNLVRPGAVMVIDAVDVLRQENLRREWERVQQWKIDNPEEAAEMRARMQVEQGWAGTDETDFQPSMWEDGLSVVPGKEVEGSEMMPF